MLQPSPRQPESDLVGDAPLPLSGVRVLALGGGIAALAAGRVLARFGAHVTVVEPPGGDPIRRLGPFLTAAPHQETGGWWLSLAANQRSITLDLATASGQRIAERLTADVVIASPALAHLAAGRPVVMVSAFGAACADDATSLTLAAVSGLMASSGAPDREPLSPPGPAVLVASGLFVALATLDALARTGHRHAHRLSAELAADASNIDTDPPSHTGAGENAPPNAAIAAGGWPSRETVQQAMGEALPIAAPPAHILAADPAQVRHHAQPTDALWAEVGPTLQSGGDEPACPGYETTADGVPTPQVRQQDAAGSVTSTEAAYDPHTPVRVDLSLAEAVTATVIYDTTAFSYHGVVRKRTAPRYSAGLVLNRTLECADGVIGLHLNTQPQWRALCEFMQRPELADDPRFATNALRAANVAALDAIVLPWARGQRVAHLFHEGQRRRIPFAQLATPAEVLASPQLAARQFFETVAHPQIGAVTLPGAPFRIGGSRGVSGCAPQLGEHQGQSLASAGLTARDLARLRAAGAS